MLDEPGFLLRRTGGYGDERKRYPATWFEYFNNPCTARKSTDLRLGLMVVIKFWP